MKLISNVCRNGSCFYKSTLTLFRIGPTELTARFETRLEFGPQLGFLLVHLQTFTEILKNLISGIITLIR